MFELHIGGNIWVDLWGVKPYSVIQGLPFSVPLESPLLYYSEGAGANVVLYMLDQNLIRDKESPDKLL